MKTGTLFLMLSDSEGREENLRVQQGRDCSGEGCLLLADEFGETGRLQVRQP